MLIRKIAVLFLDLVFTHRCCVCGEPIDFDEHLCEDCADTAPFVLPPVCPRCGRGEDHCVCRQQTKPQFERCVMVLYYLRQGHSAIALTKRGYGDVLDGLAIEMAEVIRREYGGIRFDAVTGVPKYWEDVYQLGFSHAPRLARAVSRHTGIPYRRLLRKVFPTPQQKTLSAEQRRAGIQGVFDVIRPQDAAGKTILVVDDVTTTGSTLSECAKMLKMAGAVAVYAATVAGVMPKAEGADGIDDAKVPWEDSITYELGY